eukprot:6750867-Lingulodinium_polyedra.AAC.1
MSRNSSRKRASNSARWPFERSLNDFHLPPFSPRDRNSCQSSCAMAAAATLSAEAAGESPWPTGTAARPAARLSGTVKRRLDARPAAAVGNGGGGGAVSSGFGAGGSLAKASTE